MNRISFELQAQGLRTDTGEAGVMKDPYDELIKKIRKLTDEVREMVARLRRQLEKSKAKGRHKRKPGNGQPSRRDPPA